jgi:uncharacterized damage-inducible protein DinB
MAGHPEAGVGLQPQRQHVIASICGNYSVKGHPIVFEGYFPLLSGELVPDVHWCALMPTMTDVLRNHLHYTAWASSRLVDAASALDPQELVRDFATADHNVLGTLAHVYAADRMWLGRIEGNPTARFMVPEQDMHLAVLRNDWPALHARWKQWGARLTEDSILKDVSYKSTRGDAFVTPTWQIVLHMVNHGTHHRGQVSGFLRAMGHTPPVLDVAAFYREAVR